MGTTKGFILIIKNSITLRVKDGIIADVIVGGQYGVIRYNRNRGKKIKEMATKENQQMAEKGKDTTNLNTV